MVQQIPINAWLSSTIRRSKRDYALYQKRTCRTQERDGKKPLKDKDDDDDDDNNKGGTSGGKEIKAMALGITIWQEEEFLEMINRNEW